jgi:hypothetical protein
LELMERHGPLSRAHAAALSDMSESTLRRVSAQLIREGLLSLRYGAEGPDRPKGDLLSLSRFGLLTVTEITPAHLSHRVSDTRGESLLAVTRERNPFLPLEEDIRLLLSRTTSPIPLRGQESLTVLPPILLLPAEGMSEGSVIPLRRVLSPAAILTAEEAAARELTYAPAADGHRDLLYIRDGDTPLASLLLRSTPSGAFTPSPYTHSLTASLARHLADTPKGSPARAHRIGAYLQGLLQYLSPACVAIESEQYPLPADILRAELPDRIPLLTHTASHSTPSLPQSGALRLARRLLWTLRLSQVSRESASPQP